MSLWCENCGKACHAQMFTNDHLGSDCCEGYLLRRLTDNEEGEIIGEMLDELAPAQRAIVNRLSGI